MALPITGPTTTTSRGGKTPGPTWDDSQTRWRQKPPYQLSLPYKRSIRSFSNVSCAGANPGPDASFDANVVQTYKDAFAIRMDDDRWVSALSDVKNSARAKFIASMGSTSQIATTIAEWQQTADMMGGKLLAIGRSFNALRRGNVAGAMLALSPTLPSTPQGHRWKKKWAPQIARKGSRAAANAWLELHFGWVPLAQDIYGAMDFLQHQKPLGRAEGRAHKRGTWDYVASPSGSGYTSQWRGIHDILWACRIGADWRITNPNLFLANRLGVLNPVSVAWELVPFSFVVDWFTNVGQFIAQWGDLAGVSIENPYYTVLGRDTCRSSYVVYWTFPPPTTLAKENKCVGRSCFVERKLGLPDVHLVIPPVKRVSLTRAATAISLLVQLGISKRG